MAGGRNGNHSLKNQLILYFILLATIPSLIIGVFSYLVSSRAIEEKVSNYSHQIVMQTASQLSMLLSGIEDVSLQLVTMDEINQLAKAKQYGLDSPTLESTIQNVISKMIASRTDIVGVNLLFADTGQSLVYGEPLLDLNNYRGEKVYSALQFSNSGSMWSGTYRNSNPIVTYTHIATFSRNIIDEQSGRVIATLVIGIKEFSLADTYSYLDLGPSGFSIIVDNQGYTVSDLDKSRLEKRTGFAFIGMALDNLEPERTFTADYNGERVLVAYEHIPRANWYLISVMPYSYLLQDVRANGFLTMQVAFAFIIIAILLALLISRHIFRPIDLLNQSIKALGKGNFAVRAYLRGQNEITELAASFDKMAHRIDHLINQVYESRIMKQEAEIKSLHAQINPHFLYNTLALIDGMAMQNGQAAIAEITQILSDIFRYSTSGNDCARLSEELYQVEQYLKIYALRHRGKFEYEVRSEQLIENCILPKLLLQPVVENAIRHGLDGRLNHNRLVIETRRINDHLIETVIRDNGSGFNTEILSKIREQLQQPGAELKLQQKEDNEHIGIINVHRRIKNYYGDNYGMIINSIPGIGTEIVLRLGIVLPAEDVEDPQRLSEFCDSPKLISESLSLHVQNKTLESDKI